MNIKNDILEVEKAQALNLSASLRGMNFLAVLQNRQKSAFTLTEVVITLIVIGVAASATIPMLNNNVADKKWNAARQKAKATIGEAFRLMTVNSEITTNKTTAQFVEDVIPKYLKLEKTCAPADFDKCGFPSTVKTPSGVTVGLSPKDYKWSELSNANVWQSSPNSPEIANNFTTFTGKYGNTHNTSYFFRTLDGFSVAFLYNPYCVSDTKEHFVRYTTSISGGPYYRQQSLDTVCLMGIYDMNGKSGPNKVGMDIGFVGSFYNGFETKSVSVLPHSVEKLYNQLPAAPKWNGENDYWSPLVNYCNNLGKNNDWVMPDIDESALLYVNYKLVNNLKSKDVWFFSRTPLGNTNEGYFWRVNFGSGNGGDRSWMHRSFTYAGPYVRCVRNTALK